MEIEKQKRKSMKPKSVSLGEKFQAANIQNKEEIPVQIPSY